MREQSTSSLVIQIFMVESFCVPHNLVRTFFHRNFLFIVDLEHYYNGFGGFECSYSSQCLCEPIYLNAFFFFFTLFYSPAETAKRGRSPPPHSKKASPTPR